jgi:hypothetical protein
MRKHRRRLSEDEIFERQLKMVDALDSLLARAEISQRAYIEALIELAKWGQSKRSQLES